MKKSLFHNYNNVLAFLIGFALIAVLPQNSFADKRKTETYSSQEEGGSPDLNQDVNHDSAPTPAPATPSRSSDSFYSRVKDVLERLSKLEKDVATIAASKATAVQTPKGFDTVPENQRAAITKRIQVAQQLVQEYGRAYDYRSMTLKELEQILASLQMQDREHTSSN